LGVAAGDEGFLTTMGHLVADTAPDTAVTVGSGAMATSSVTGRRWRRGERTVHHIVDPRTGDAVDASWRTVSVAAGSCVDANTASTAAIVLGADAVDWLARRRLPARLVAVSGQIVTVAGWPREAS
jgi:thiamine biosynthesis lipoprotein